MKDKMGINMKKNLTLLTTLLIASTGCVTQENLNIHQDSNTTQTVNISDKAKVQNNDFTTENPLHDAVRAHDLELVKFLVKQNADINLQDNYGYTPLHLAVRLHNYEITNFLVSQEANLNTVDSFGDTPLLDSTRNNDTNISKVLICNGANRNVKDVHHMSTLNNSSKNKNKHISTLLRADQLEPYCQKELLININEANKEKICGQITKGYVTDLKVTFEDEITNQYGPYDADVDNKNKTWCLDATDKDLAQGIYSINANATDYVVNESNATLNPYIYANGLTIAIDDINKSNIQNPEICGTSNSSSLESVKLSLLKDDNTTYGAYQATVDNASKTWCTTVEDNLTDGNYTISAVGFDTFEQNASDSKSPYRVMLPMIEQELEENNASNSLLALPLLKIETTPTINDNTPKICGSILEGNISQVDVKLIDESKLDHGPYGTFVKEDNSWCVDITDNLENGKYNIVASGIDEHNQTAIDHSTTNIYVIPGLYEALMDEFQDDFTPWDAQLEKDTLLFRFKNPTVLFKRGSSELRDRFKTIISDFFPRYNKILLQYKNEIATVYIEGHASSEHSRGRTIEEKYNLNLILSQSRADAVLSYSKSIDHLTVNTNRDWINSHFKSEGKSSSQLIYNEDNSENKEKSRRVEFRIETFDYENLQKQDQSIENIDDITLEDDI